MPKMSMQDASFLRLESPTTPMHVAFMMKFVQPKDSGPDYVQKLYTSLLSFAVTAPPFNYRMVKASSAGRLPGWDVDDNVDLTFHLRHEAVTHPGGERELGLLMSRLQSTPLDPARPLWEFILIEGLAGRRFAICLKMHHALADGVRMMNLLLPSLTSSANIQSVPPWARLSSVEGSTENSSNTEQWKQLFDGVVKGFSKSKNKTGSLFPRAPKSLLNGPISNQRRFVTHSLSLQRVKVLAKLAEATVNDVVLAVCSGALRRYLEGLDAMPESSLVVGMPMALPHHESLLYGNALGGLSVAIASDIDNLRDRLSAIQQSTQQAKAGIKRIPNAVNKTLGTASNWVNSIPVNDEKRARRTPVTNLSISNVPGPKEELFFQGAFMEGIFPATVLMPDQRFNIMLISYNGGLHFGLIACPDQLPQIQKIAVLLPESLDALEREFAI